MTASTMTSFSGAGDRSLLQGDVDQVVGDGGGGGGGGGDGGGGHGGCGHGHRRRRRRRRLLLVLFVLVGGHVPGEVVAFAEALPADGTLELVLVAAPLVRVGGGVLVLVLRPHVVDQVGGHAEVHVALGAHVLRGQRERRQRGG